MKKVLTVFLAVVCFLMLSQTQVLAKSHAKQKVVGYGKRPKAEKLAHHHAPMPPMHRPPHHGHHGNFGLNLNYGRQYYSGYYPVPVYTTPIYTTPVVPAAYYPYPTNNLNFGLRLSI